MKIFPIPYLFLKDNVYINWHDMLWGYEHKFISCTEIIAMAENLLVLDSANPIEMELAYLGKQDVYQIENNLYKLVKLEPICLMETSTKKWLYLVLAWLFENRSKLSDSLEEVNKIYADFDYPEEIEGFIGYMPVTDEYNPSMRSLKHNKLRLFSKWEQYLVETKQNYQVKRT